MYYARQRVREGGNLVGAVKALLFGVDNLDLHGLVSFKRLRSQLGRHPLKLQQRELPPLQRRAGLGGL